MSTTTESPHNSQLLFIGQQCHKEQCYMVDFLPFKCDHCQHKFCADHYKPGDHACEKYDPAKHDRIAPNCPLCDTPVAIPQGQDPNVRMSQHIDRECKVTTGRSKAGTMPICARGRCGKKLVAPIKCNSCNRQFCAEHRYPTSHSCNSTSASSSSTSLSKGAPSAGQRVANQTSAASAAAMAAIKRSLGNNTGRSVPSSSKPASTQPVPVRAAQAQPSTAASSSTKLNNPFSKTDRRARAEQESRLKSMRERAKKGILSDTEKVQLAEMEAAIANGKKDTDCSIM